MKSVFVRQALPAGHPEALLDGELPEPRPGPEDLLVRVEAVAVNPADVRMRLRKADDGQPAVLGWDVAGEVLAVGAAVRGFAVGERVYYAGELERPGANSERHVVRAALVGRRPRTLSAAQAAALPLSALTAWEALYEQLGLSPEPAEAAAGAAAPGSLLIVGAAGGVGSMALQLARRVPGLQVLATASRPASRAWCLGLGAHAVLDHHADLAAQLAALGRPAPERVLLLQAPDQHYPALAALLAPQGRLCCVLPFETPPDLNALMRKSASFHWTFMFTRSLFDTPDLARQGWILAQVAQWVDQGLLRSTLAEDLGPICARGLREAHQRLERGDTVGKLVLSGFAP